VHSHASFGPPEFKSQTAVRLVQPFLHSSRQGVAILHNGPPLFPLKIDPSHGGSGPRLIHGSLGPPKSSNQTVCQSIQAFLHSSPQSVPILHNGPYAWFPRPDRVLNPNCISTELAVFAGLTTVIKRQTDRRTDQQTMLLSL